MPKGSYSTLKNAKENAKKIIKKTKCDAVKIESNNKNFKIINELIKAKIPVMGHIGFTPQFKKTFQVEGKNKIEVNKLVKEAQLVQRAGAFSIILECVTPHAAQKITNSIKFR